MGRKEEIIPVNMVVYAPIVTPRVEYIFSILLAAIGFDGVQFTNDSIYFSACDLPKINYSTRAISSNEVFIKPVDLLFEQQIHPQNLDCFQWSGLTCFFKSEGSDIPFDLFAASFYLITRYEEYLPHQSDMYGRFAHGNSIAYQQDFLKVPLVNLWLEELKKIIIIRFPFVQLEQNAFRFIPTYDIDIAWSHLNKGFFRNTASFFLQFFRGKWLTAVEKLRVLFGGKHDPFDCYTWLNQLHEANELNGLYFFLVASKNKAYDKNILPSKHAMQELIEDHSKKYEVGIHPSWQSGDDGVALKREIELLGRLTNKPIDKSRQHYIRMRMPDTYQQLIQQGIAADYSMGYGSINGFRASYCLPYKWYDLSKETATELTIHPFCFMDANAYYEQHYTSDQAITEMEYYYQITKQVHGELITIWHNHFLGTDTMFAGWRTAYETFISNMVNGIHSKHSNPITR